MLWVCTLPQNKFYTITIYTMWRALEVIKGQKFWKRTYLWEVAHRGKFRMLKCQCECGKIGYIPPSNLVRGKNKSCYRCSIVTHRVDSPRMYCIWDKMKERCRNPKHTGYHNYWERWIKILWNSFDEFYEDMHESYEIHVKEYWEKDTTIDRIDSNWDYCKENCKWSTRAEQNNNQRRTHHVEYKWKSYNSLSELCRDIGANYQLVRDRVRYWWSMDDAIEKKRLYIRNINNNDNR